MSVHRVAHQKHPLSIEKPGTSFTFSESVLARAAHKAPGQQVIPPLQNLSLRTAPTAAATAPNKQFTLWIKALSYVHLRPNNGFQAGAGAVTYERVLYETFKTTGAESPKDDDIILWMQTSDMPSDNERILYTKLIRNLFIDNLKRAYGNVEKKFEVDTVLYHLTPADAPTIRVSRCNPNESTTTYVWRASTDAQKQRVKEIMGNPTVEYIKEADMQDTNAAAKLGRWFIGPTPKDGWTAPEYTSITKEPNDAQEERWKCTVVPSQRGGITYRFEYVDDMPREARRRVKPKTG